jgi:hypothetical protein
MEGLVLPPPLEVLVAAASAFVLGGIWYGPLFGRPWQRLAGLTGAQLAASSPIRVYGLSAALAVVQAYVFGLFLGPDPSIAFGVGVGLLAGACWVGAAFGINDLFERRPAGLWAVNAGYHVLVFALYGLVFSAWR